VVAADYLTRPEADVRADLEGLGLTVAVTATEGGGPVGTVKDVSPTARSTREPRHDRGRRRARAQPGKPDKPGKGAGKKKEH
jgi:hypothetical protein